MKGAQGSCVLLFEILLEDTFWKSEDIKKICGSLKNATNHEIIIQSNGVLRSLGPYPKLSFYPIFIYDCVDRPIFWVTEYMHFRDNGSSLCAYIHKLKQILSSVAYVSISIDNNILSIGYSNHVYTVYLGQGHPNTKACIRKSELYHFYALVEILQLYRIHITTTLTFIAFRAECEKKALNFRIFFK